MSRRVRDQSLGQRAARWILALLGWSVEARLPPAPRYVVIGAPHTTNWDLPLALLAMPAMGFRGRWVAKHTIFRGPLGPLMRSLGGIPVDRRKRQNFVEQVADRMLEEEEFVLVIAPEGTRSWTGRWKTGFYYIALGAEVPIALGYADYPRKRVGVGGWFMPSGDLEADMDRIREFYADKEGKRPEKKSAIRVSAPETPEGDAGSPGRGDGARVDDG